MVPVREHMQACQKPITLLIALLFQAGRGGEQNGPELF